MVLPDNRTCRSLNLLCLSVPLRNEFFSRGRYTLIFFRVVCFVMGSIVNKCNFCKSGIKADFISFCVLRSVIHK